MRATLEANDSYWRGKPAIQARHLPAGAGRRDPHRRPAHRQGRHRARPELGRQRAVIKGDAQLQILSIPTERIGYLFVNALWGPTKDVRVRRAIAHALDRGLIIEALLGGYGRPVDIMLTPANFGYMADIKGYAHDLARAKALVKEAGAEGAELPFLTSPVYDQRIVQAIQQMLGEVGLKVTISMSDQATFLRRRQGQPQDAGSLSIGRWSCACQDADGVIQPLFHSASTWAKYSNPVYDEAVEKARATLDQTERLVAVSQGAGDPARRTCPASGSTRTSRSTARARACAGSRPRTSRSSCSTWRGNRTRSRWIRARHAKALRCPTVAGLGFTRRKRGTA